MQCFTFRCSIPYSSQVGWCTYLYFPKLIFLWILIQKNRKERLIKQQWWKPQCRLKATSSYHFSSSSVHSSDVCQLPGRHHSLSFFLTYFLSNSKEAYKAKITQNVHLRKATKKGRVQLMSVGINVAERTQWKDKLYDRAFSQHCGFHQL